MFCSAWISLISTKDIFTVDKKEFEVPNPTYASIKGLISNKGNPFKIETSIFKFVSVKIISFSLYRF